MSELYEAIDWLKDNLEMDNTGHVKGCGVDEGGDCRCSSLPGRLLGFRRTAHFRVGGEG